ncbi:MAG: histidine kinase dimerization/phospho-acceptor domain-containing protein [Pirellulaceae bacterium]
MDPSLGPVDPDGGFVSLRTDIIKQQPQQELAFARNPRRSRIRPRATSLANMSHEIRTPMTAILGFADLPSRMIPRGIAS